MVLNAVRSLRQCNQYVFRLFIKNRVPEAKSATKYIVSHVLGRKTVCSHPIFQKLNIVEFVFLKKFKYKFNIFTVKKICVTCVYNLYVQLHGVHPRTKINNKQWAILKTLANRRITGEPLQYILEEWDFCNLVLNLRPPVLIPRPETEVTCGFYMLKSCKCDTKETGIKIPALCLFLFYKQYIFSKIYLMSEMVNITTHY